MLIFLCLGSLQHRLYKNIIEEVINNVRDDFLDEGIDEQVLLEVKQAWEQKVAATHATDHNDSLGGSQIPVQQQHSTQQSQQQMQQSTHEQVTSGLTGQGGSSFHFIGVWVG